MAKRKMKLIDFLMTCYPHTLISVQRSDDDTASMYAIKDADKFTLQEVRGLVVREFYPEHYKSMYAHGITVIVEDESDE